MDTPSAQNIITNSSAPGLTATDSSFREVQDAHMQFVATRLEELHQMMRDFIRDQAHYQSTHATTPTRNDRIPEKLPRHVTVRNQRRLKGLMKKLGTAPYSETLVYYHDYMLDFMKKLMQVTVYLWVKNMVEPPNWSDVTKDPYLEEYFNSDKIRTEQTSGLAPMLPLRLWRSIANWVSYI